MPSREDEQRVQLLEFARCVYELMRSWEAAHPHDTFKIDPKLSRILALVPEYDSGRLRKPVPARGAAKAPTIFTARELADRLGAPLCALLPSKDHVVFSDAQLQQITGTLRVLLSIFSPAAPRADVFRGIRGIESERLQVVRVTSDSMSPLLLTGDRVLIDTAHASARRRRRRRRRLLHGVPVADDAAVFLAVVDAPLRPQDRLLRR